MATEKLSHAEEEGNIVVRYDENGRILAMLLEETGIPYYSLLAELALGLHEYPYHGPDPDMTLTRYPNRRKAAEDIEYMATRILEVVEKRVKPRLEQEDRWTREHDEALKTLEQELAAPRQDNKTHNTPEPEQY